MVNQVKKAKVSTTAEVVVENKEVPVLVYVLAVLVYIGAGISALLGLLFIFGASFLSEFINALPEMEGAGLIGGIFFVFMGIIFVGVAILDFFIARGLWNAKNWARIVEIVLMCLGTLWAIISLITGNWWALISLAFNAGFGAYLLFSQEVKDVFE